MFKIKAIFTEKNFLFIRNERLRVLYKRKEYNMGEFTIGSYGSMSVPPQKSTCSDTIRVNNGDKKTKTISINNGDKTTEAILKFVDGLATAMGLPNDEPVKEKSKVKKSKPPKSDKNPPKPDPSVSELSVKHPENAGKSVRQQDGTTLEYDEDGYLTNVFDEKGKILKHISRSPDGSISSYEENEYDSDGHVAKTVYRNSEGAVTEYLESKYDDNGNEIRTIRRTPDGKVVFYQESEYDENGIPIGSVVRAPNGEPMYD